MKELNTLGGRIRELRKSKGLNRRELSLKIGVAYAQISKYENDMAKPSFEILRNIAKEFKVTYDYLIDGYDKSKYIGRVMERIKSCEERLSDHQAKRLYDMVMPFLDFNEVVSRGVKNETELV